MATENTVVDRSIVTTLDDPDNTASQKDGLSASVERLHRLHATSLLNDAATLLRVGASTYATSCAILHRAYHQLSLRDHNVWSVSLASTVLACKMEEAQKTLREIILVYAHIYRRRRLMIRADDAQVQTILQANSKHVAASDQASKPLSERESVLRRIKPISPFGPVYHDWYNQLVETENLLLRTLGFTLYWIPDSHPHKFILYFLQVLLDKPDDSTKKLCQAGWDYCNLSCRLDLSLRYAPEVIACTAIHLAAKDLGIEFKQNWWKVFVETQDVNLSNIGNAILGLVDTDLVPSCSYLTSIKGRSFLDPDSYVWSVGD